MNPHVLKQKIVRPGVGSDAIGGIVVDRPTGTAATRNRRDSEPDALRVPRQFDALYVNIAGVAEVEYLKDAIPAE
jgi:hypothetical protein